MNDTCFYTMSIELRSDMCCGTGESNGVSVDQVTALDPLGFPYIPAKRLKGLLREQAEIVSPDDVGSLFGRMGDEAPGKLRFGDAEVRGRSAIAAMVGTRASGVSPRRVADVYTTTRSSTRIEADGIAADHSLRTIQLVKRCDSAGTPTRFVCRVEGEGLTDAEKDAFRRVVRCLRSIGLNKSRGLGEVACSGEWADAEGSPAEGTPATTGEGAATVGYRIALESGAALRIGPGGPVDHIPGSVVQGIFARQLSTGNQRLLKEHVLRGARFSNAYLEVSSEPGGEGSPSEPVPLTLKTMKNAPGNTGLPLYDAAAGAAPSRAGGGKPVQQVPIGGYGAMVDGEYVVAQVDESFSFHSSRAESPQGQQLYSMRSIDAGQSFTGTITAASEALAAFRAAVDQRGGRFTIGSAGSAGYGSCSLSLFEPLPTEPLILGEGDRVEIRLVSDVVFVDTMGANSTDPAAFALALSDSGALGFEFDAEVGSGSGKCRAFVRNGTVGGYSAHWHLPKRQFLTFGKGSVLVATVTSCPSGEVPSTAWFGQLQTEGFGEMRVEKIDEAPARTYSKGHPAKAHAHESRQRRAQEADGQAAVESFKRELAFSGACEAAVMAACGEADRIFDGLPASKSSAMRIGALIPAATKPHAARSPEDEFESAALANFSDDPVLKRACLGAAGAYRSVAEPHAGVFTDVQERALFTRFMQTYLHRVKQLYSLSEGGLDE